jgi:hypothetical protein
MTLITSKLTALIEEDSRVAKDGIITVPATHTKGVVSASRNSLSKQRPAQNPQASQGGSIKQRPGPNLQASPGCPSRRQGPDTSDTSGD